MALLKLVVTGAHLQGFTYESYGDGSEVVSVSAHMEAEG